MSLCAHAGRMALFSRKKETARLTEREALAGVALCAMYADGVADAEEDEDLVAVLTGLEAFADADEDAVRDALVRANEVSADLGDDALLDACCASLPSHLKPMAYAVALDIVGADGAVVAGELGFAHRLQKRLGLTDEECGAIRRAVEAA